MIEVNQVCKSFGMQRVLSNATLSVPSGELALLVGSNGAGKSTLLRALAGVSSTDSGRIDIAGRGDPSHQTAARAALSCLPQTPAFHPQFTVRGILAFYARLRGVDTARVADVASLAGLDEVLGKRTAALSGGLRQRLAIALLLLPGAPVLLLDEPGLSLDPDWRDRMCSLLRDEAERGSAILVATHLLTEWHGRADRILECRDGTITELPSAAPDTGVGLPPSQAEAAAAGAAISGSEANGTHISKSGMAVPDMLTGQSHRRYPDATSKTRLNLAPFGSEAKAAQAGARRLQFPPPPNAPAALRAMLLREFFSARLNRFLQVFGVMALLGGIGSAVAGETIEAVAALAFQASLYFTPVFALLLGASTARAEQEEWPLLFPQPMRRSLVPCSKFVANAAGFALLLVLLLLPPALVGVPKSTVAGLHASTAGLAAVFVALGLWCGFAFGDRVRALLAAAILWIAMFLLYDMAALALAGVPAAQNLPDAWTALLMLNPVDAFRIHLLFSLEQIPPESASKSPLASWWIAHSGSWLAILCTAWCATALTAASLAVNKLSGAH